MWHDPDPGGQKITPSTQELNDLGDENQQQLVLAQLKEMLRKEQSSVPQEKVYYIKYFIYFLTTYCLIYLG